MNSLAQISDRDEHDIELDVTICRLVLGLFVLIDNVSGQHRLWFRKKKMEVPKYSSDPRASSDMIVALGIRGIRLSLTQKENDLWEAAFIVFGMEPVHCSASTAVRAVANAALAINIPPPMQYFV